MKKFITLFLSFVLYFNTFSTAHASAAEKWVVEKIVYESSSKMMNVSARSAISTAANNSLYNARVPVTASATGSTVATMVRLGVAGAAIYALVAGVGWIIDNGVVKKPTPNDKPKLYWSWIKPWDNTYKPGFGTDTRCNGVYGTYGSALDSFVYCTKTYDHATDVSCTARTSTNYSCTVTRSGSLTSTSIDQLSNPNGQETTYTPVPENELGEKINNSPSAPQVLPDVYSPNNPVGGAAPDATSDALDNAPPVPETQPTGNTKPKPNVDTDGDGVPDIHDPTKPSLGEEFELPAFCEWATTMCAWYVKYKEDSQKTDETREKEQTHRETQKTFWQKVEDSYTDAKTKIKTAYDDAKEYFTKDRDDKDKDELDIPVPNTPQIDTDIGFGGSCPADKTANINMGVGIIKMDFTYTHICTVASDIRGIVIFCGFFIGALIIGGIKQ